MEPRNRFQGMDFASLCSLADRYDNPIPTRFLAPIDCLKIPALVQGNVSVCVSKRLREERRSQIRAAHLDKTILIKDASLH
jgi:hypothetical protein